MKFLLMTPNNVKVTETRVETPRRHLVGKTLRNATIL